MPPIMFTRLLLRLREFFWGVEFCWAPSVLDPLIVVMLDFLRKLKLVFFYLEEDCRSWEGA